MRQSIFIVTFVSCMFIFFGCYNANEEPSAPSPSGDAGATEGGADGQADGGQETSVADSPADGGAADAQLCKPNEQQQCVPKKEGCSLGYQVCASTGTFWGSCVCPQDSPADGGTGGSAGNDGGAGAGGSSGSDSGTGGADGGSGIGGSGGSGGTGGAGDGGGSLKVRTFKFMHPADGNTPLSVTVSGLFWGFKDNSWFDLCSTLPGGGLVKNGNAYTCQYALPASGKFAVNVKLEYGAGSKLPSNLAVQYACYGVGTNCQNQSCFKDYGTFEMDGVVLSVPGGFAETNQSGGCNYGAVIQ